MEPTPEEPKDVIVLGAIKRGTSKFEKIQSAAQIDAEELNSILEKLEKRDFITVEEKKGWLGKKIVLSITEKESTNYKESGIKCHYCTKVVTRKN